jgi:hypothetical protein
MFWMVLRAWGSSRMSDAGTPWGAVGAGGGAEDDDGIEVGLCGVVGGEGLVVGGEDKGHGEDD